MNIQKLSFSDYAKTETERVKEHLPVLLHGDVRFAFIPDLHYKYIDEMRTAVFNLVSAVNCLNRTEKIDFLCLGGDNVGNYPPSMEEHIDMMRELASLMSYCEVPWLYLKGNHDDNSIHGEVDHTHRCRSGFEVGDAVQYEIFSSHATDYSNYHSGGKNCLYGYWDIKEADTRFILLNSSDAPTIIDQDGMLKYNGQWDNAYGSAQLAWICENALHEAPKYVFFLEHIPFDGNRYSESHRIGEEALDLITEAFMHGRKLDISSDTPDFEYRIQADFSGTCHSIPARIAGHCHYDSSLRDDLGILNITTMLSGRKISGVYPDDKGILYKREPYSALETSMDIFTFSPQRGMLYATRYGSGADRKFSL